MTAPVAAPGALADGYDLLLFDLDGVVYVGEQAVPGAPAALTELHRRGVPICYVTNNASRSAETVARLLTQLGVPADAGEVVTSAQAGAQALAVRLPVGAPVLVVGAEALAAEVAAVGLNALPAGAQRAATRPSGDSEAVSEKPVAVIQGYGPEVGWRQLAEASVAINGGALWVATNTDRTLPSPEGPLPGNGALVAALSVATGRDPDLVVGKPSPELFVTAVRRARARRPLVVGDRLDTDIEAAVRAGCPSVLVLTGVAKPIDAWLAPEGCRPTYLAAELTDLLEAYPRITAESGTAECGGWRAAQDGDRWSLTETPGEAGGVAVDALRALCAARWSRPDSSPAEIAAGTPAAARVLRELDLPTAR